MTLQQYADNIGIELNNETRQSLLVMKQSGSRTINSRRPLSFRDLMK